MHITNARRDREITLPLIRCLSELALDKPLPGSGDVILRSFFPDAPFGFGRPGDERHVADKYLALGVYGRPFGPYLSPPVLQLLHSADRDCRGKW